MKKAPFFAVFSLLLGAQILCANELAINGEFKGDALPGTVPGWTIETGSAVRIPIDRDDYAVELNGKTKIRSRLCPVSGDNLKLESEVRGSGMGRISFIAFDRDGRELNYRANSACFSGVFMRGCEIRTTVPVPPEAAFVAVTAESAENSKIIIEEIEAEFKAPWRKSPLVNGTMPLTDGRFYPLSALTGHPFSATISVGKDFDFELEEKSGDFWQVISFDRNICKVKTEHDRDGVWPRNTYKCEVEIDALCAGATTLILRSKSGREVAVKITVTSGIPRK